MQDTKSSALLAHIVAQTQSNIDFLVSQNYLRASDAASILSKLASLSENTQTERVNGNANEEREDVRNPVLTVADRLRQLNTGGSSNGVGGGDREERDEPPKAVMAATRRVIPPLPPPAQRTPQAKALWDYNADGSDPNDLSFRSGDVIEIISETNADWWTGRLDGRQGLFPSNYVEKLPSSASPARSPSSVGSPNPIPVPEPFGHSQMPAFPSPGPAPYSAGPPQPAWQNQYGYGNEKQHQVYAAPPPGPPPQQMQMQAAPPAGPPVPTPEPEKKKNKFGGLGNTMATSAAGGVGFGAGAAIGSGIINSIF